MPTKSRPSRKTVRRHKKSTTGKIKVPLDVSSEKDLPSFKKLLGQKPLTIILVYATWCPHCHTMMPHFDAAAKSPKNTVSAVKINESMLSKVNSFVKTNVNKSAPPLKVDGYPSIILVNKKAEKVTDIEPVRDTNVMQKVMEESGSLAEQSGLNSSLHLNKNKVNRNLSPSEVINEVVENEIVSPSNNAINTNKGSSTLASVSVNKLSNINNDYAPSSNNKETMKNAIAPAPVSAFSNMGTNVGVNRNKKNNLQPTAEMKKQAEAIESVVAPISPLSPPTTSSDMNSTDLISNDLSPSQKVGGGRQGGSLYQALSQTTYTLAPAAVLVGLAATVMNKNSRGSQATRKKRNKRRN
jgi:thiol-disulfide isomerase/thioredoxin